MKKITANDIDYNKSYSGYLWYSDESKPKIFNSDILQSSMLTTLPFILEGYLYCPDEGGVCINIKNIDGEYHIHQVNLSDTDQNQLERFSFLASAPFENIGIKKFKAIQYWKAEKDELCDGMEVLKPSWIVFEGFEYTTSHK
ncbi:TIGR04423 family type III CRISPR-associated protein [Belliella kenyensis]|uniref:TIGR04423 family type III CRISPR-associated protein n=1 Tax=Belliella kenyensis TaxID=1472724 RepID=A0ABV8EQ59_9BACT|nr:TIGR04423 family type III CRISPR-associated protein [Belliella kenyensis]MCH7402135.1 TIGR04423 family type III CRISPR-associated protein [Belliella kenyensis]MDN3601650.1 TIGR04423 family type III CRISPR-associated protein [Belliella kenyensis]